MPREAFLAELGDTEPVLAVEHLARRFRVSRDAAAIRLRGLGRLTQAEVDDIRRETARLVEERRERERETEGGPPHYRTHLRNLGPRYVSAVLEARDSNDISLADVAHFLEAKLSTVDRMETELVQRGTR
jgi:Zn-dependent peptidase ImmA (M78 family)